MVSEKSKPLPYWLFLLSGALISGYATFIINQGADTNKNSMLLFVYVGLIFIGIGILKLIFSWILRKKDKKLINKLSDVDYIDREEEKIIKNYETTVRKENLQSSINLNENQVSPNTQYIYCRKCGYRTFSDSIFCPKCGFRLR